ncbi:hypothetical protein PFISCL1PPCAC_8921, partial [Pristionchus fissidentatus]
VLPFVPSYDDVAYFIYYYGIFLALIPCGAMIYACQTGRLSYDSVIAVGMYSSFWMFYQKMTSSFFVSILLTAITGLLEYGGWMSKDKRNISGSISRIGIFVVDNFERFVMQPAL